MAVRTIIGVASNDSTASVITAEASIGRQFGARRHNNSMDHPLVMSNDASFNKAGLWVYRNSNCQQKPPTPPGLIFGGWAGVANGEADDWLAAGASAIRANFTALRPYLWSPHHEQRVDSDAQIGVGKVGSADDYKAYFRYVVNYMRGAGVADRIRFCFVPGIGQYIRDDDVSGVSVLDPGRDVVDVYGVDVYQNGRDFAQHNLVAVGKFASDRGRLAMIGEFGVDTPEYLASALNLFREQGNWALVCTDTASVTPATTPIWRQAVVDVAHFAFKGDVLAWPSYDGGPVTPPPDPEPEPEPEPSPDCCDDLAEAEADLAAAEAELLETQASLAAAEQKLDDIRAILGTP